MSHFKVSLSILCIISFNFVSADIDLKQPYRANSVQTDIKIPVFSGNSSLNKNYDYFRIRYDEYGTNHANNLNQTSDLVSLPYDIEFLKPADCIPVCIKAYENNYELQMIKEAILSDYHHYWYFGDVPVYSCSLNEENLKNCSFGFPMGFYIDKLDKIPDNCDFADAREPVEGYYIFNHLDFTVDYKFPINSGLSEKRFYIQNVTVRPRSLRHKNFKSPDCSGKEPMLLPADNHEIFTVTFTYTVTYNFLGFEPPTYPVRSRPPFIRRKLPQIPTVLYNTQKYDFDKSFLTFKTNTDFIPELRRLKNVTPKTFNTNISSSLERYKFNSVLPPLALLFGLALALYCATSIFKKCMN